MLIRSLLSGLALALAAGAVPGAQQRPVFTTSVEVARLDVQVVDADGRPIQDLRPDEIRVTEAGDERPVLLLQHIADAGRSYVEAAQRTIASEVSTNQGAPRGQLYVLLFDQEHITPGGEQKARRAAERFIRERLQPQDRVAVYGVPLPGPAISFTNNTRAALAELEKVRGTMDRVNSGMQLEMTTYEAFAIQRGNEEVLTRFMTASPKGGSTSRASVLADAIANGRREGESADALRRLVQENAKIAVTKADGDSRRFLQLAAEAIRSLRAVDGRKTILLFSEGFFSDNLATEMRATAAAAAEVYGVIYAFDLNDRVTQNGLEPSGNDAAAEALGRTESIGGLAADTNGELIMDASTHLDQALATLAAPSNDYYIVGFEPSADARENRRAYRPVNVTVTRAGAKVRTRTGYTLGSNGRDVTLSASRRVALDAALAAPFGQQGLRVEYTTYQTHGADNSERVILALESELPVHTGDDPANADVVFVVRDARSGQVAASGQDTIALPSSNDPGRASGTGAWRVQFPLTPGDYLMRCVVREPGGLMGSADRQFTVRALGGPDVSASDLILGRPGPNLPVRADAYTGDPLTGTLRLFARNDAQLEGVTVRLDLLDLTGLDGTAAPVGGAGVTADTRNVDGQVLRDVFFELPLTRVAPGDYIARAEVRSRGELVTSLRRQVRVIAGRAPATAAAGASAEAPASDAASSAIAGSLVAAAAASPDDPVARQAANGVAALKSGRYAEAVTLLSAAFDANPKNGAVAFVLGWAQRGAGNMTAAVSAFRNAALTDPASIPAHLALADTYLAMNAPALAVQALEAGLAKVPNAIELTRLLEAIRK
jgi:VWFA-related protein